MSVLSFLKDSDSLIDHHCAVEEALESVYTPSQWNGDETPGTKKYFTSDLQRQVTTASTTDGSTRAAGSAEKIKLRFKDNTAYLSDDEDFSFSRKLLQSNINEKSCEDLEGIKSNGFISFTNTSAYSNRRNTIAFGSLLGTFEKEMQHPLCSTKTILPTCSFIYDVCKNEENSSDDVHEQKIEYHAEEREKLADISTGVCYTLIEPLLPLEEEGIDDADENMSASQNLDKITAKPTQLLESVCIAEDKSGCDVPKVLAVETSSTKKMELRAGSPFQCATEKIRRFSTMPISFSTNLSKQNSLVKIMHETMPQEILGNGKAKFVGVVSSVDPVLEGQESDPNPANNAVLRAKLPWHKRIFCC